MQDRIRKALCGDQEALLSLYDEHKKKVLSLCYYLLQEEKEADHAAALIFKKTFEELVAGRIPSEEEFSRLIIRKTVMHCKALALKKSNRAFRVPINSNFVTTYDPERLDCSGDMQQIVLRNLPTFHRYIYVLNIVCQYSIEDISRIFAISPRIVENALNAERANVDKIVSCVKRKYEGLQRYTIDDFHAELVQGATCWTISSVDATVKLNVQSICEPIQKEMQRKGNFILGATGIVALIAVILLVCLSNRSKEPAVDLENANSVEIITESIEETTVPPESDNGDVAAFYYADIEIRDYGTITVALDAAVAPETVANFVALARSGFYDGLTFHRIIEGFMMQGGDPNGNGTGGADETINGEFYANGFDNPLSHTRGAISMARSNDYNSASSQFFIVHKDSVDSLDGLYACFGYVTEGMEVVDAICESAEPTDGNGSIAQEKQPVILSISIRKVDEINNAENEDYSDSLVVADNTDAAA